MARVEHESSEVLFARDERAAFEGDLAALDGTLRAVAIEYRCRYLESAGKGWPGRTLRRRSFIRTFRLRLQLNPNYLQDRVQNYVLSTQWSIEFGEVLTRNLRYEVIERFDRETLFGNPAVIAKAVRSVLARELDVRTEK